MLRSSKKLYLLKEDPEEVALRESLKPKKGIEVSKMKSRHRREAEEARRRRKKGGRERFEDSDEDDFVLPVHVTPKMRAKVSSPSLQRGMREEDDDEEEEEELRMSGSGAASSKGKGEAGHGEAKEPVEAFRVLVGHEPLPVDKLIAAPHHPSSWLREFRQARDKGRKEALEALILQQTTAVAEAGTYVVGQNDVDMNDLLPSSLEETVMVDDLAEVEIKSTKTVGQIANGDALDAVVVASHSGLKVGLVFTITETQDTPVEHGLELRSSWPRNAAQLGQLPAAGQLVVAPSVHVFRGSSGRGYPFLPSPVPVLCLGSSAPRVDRGGMTAGDQGYIAKQLDLAFSHAASKGVKALVLSPLGADSGCPPAAVHTIAKGVIANKYKGAFEMVIFVTDTKAFEDVESSMSHKENGCVVC